MGATTLSFSRRRPAEGRAGSGFRRVARLLLFNAGMPRLFIALTGVLLVVACPGEDDDPLPVASCEYGGKTYTSGQSFPATDGCNTCQCGPDGSVACTEIGCSGAGCLHNGTRYSIGDSVPSSDGCNTCSCTEPGVVACTTKACPPPAGCEYAGARHAPGASFPSTDGCNTCTCLEGGGVACTKKACPSPPAACRRTGCSGQICADQDVASDCAFRPEYACYQKAICERQPDGSCGFTPSAELMRCLAGGVDGGQPAPACAVAASYEYGLDGGLRFYVDRAFLGPGSVYKYRRRYVGGDRPDMVCAPALPACGAADLVTPQEIEARLAHPDVQAAFARTPAPLFGRDTRPVDGVVFEVRRADGRGFLVGQDCEPTLSSCQAVPPGVKALRDRLVALDRQQLKAAECVTAGF